MVFRGFLAFSTPPGCRSVAVPSPRSTRCCSPVFTRLGFGYICPWVAGIQALHGDIAVLYDPAAFVKIQEALVGPKDYFYPNWPYPPTFFFVLIPFALLPYAYAFIIWDVLTLTGCIVVVYLIVRRGGLARLQDARPAAGEPLVCTTHRWRELNSNF